MSIIKKFKLGGSSNPTTQSASKHEGNVLKSSRVIPTGMTVTPADTGELPTDSSAGSDFSFDNDLSSFDIDEPDTVPTSPEPVYVHQQPTVDESQVRSSIMSELQGNFDDLLDAISNLKKARDSVIESAQSQLIEMATLIAEKVIQKQIETDPTLINSVIEGTFDKISGSDRIIFKINPADSDAVTAFQPTIESRLVGVEKISIQQDSTIEPGGCIIETDLGFVDVTIQEKMNLIVQTFKKLKSTL